MDFEFLALNRFFPRKNGQTFKLIANDIASQYIHGIKRENKKDEGGVGKK